MRGETIAVTKTVEFFIESCCNCGVLFGITDELHSELLRKKEVKKFYCPNGHEQWYLGKSDKKLLTEAETAKRNAEAALQAERDQRLATERNLKATETELKRHRSRAKGGACPVCKRTFVQVTRHMKTQHPDFTP